LLTFVIGLLYLLRLRRPEASDGEDEAPLAQPGPPLRRVRRVESTLLVIAGLIMIAVTLRTGDKAHALPPAAPVATVQDEKPARVEAPTTQSLANPSDKSIPVTVIRSYPFIWPAQGPITSEIGPWHPLGIDIGLQYQEDSMIRAAARGTVTFAGGTKNADYGYHVIIDHGGGMETIYAHLDEVYVKEGQVVRQGEFLGLGGNTGRSDGKHLHFEVKTHGAQVNPLEVLPEQGASRPESLKMDCAKEALVVDSGAPVFLDFDGALPAGSRIADAQLQSVNTSPQALPALAETESDVSVLVDTSPTVTGTGNDDEYALKLTASVAEDASEMVCAVFVRTHTTRTVFYVRPTSTPTPLPPEAAPPTSTPTPTNTPTPTPTPTKTPYPTRPPSNQAPKQPAKTSAP